MKVSTHSFTGTEFFYSKCLFWSSNQRVSTERLSLRKQKKKWVTFRGCGTVSECMAVGRCTPRPTHRLCSTLTYAPTLRNCTGWYHDSWKLWLWTLLFFFIWVTTFLLLLSRREVDRFHRLFIHHRATSPSPNKYKGKQQNGVNRGNQSVTSRQPTLLLGIRKQRPLSSPKEEPPNSEHDQRECDDRQERRANVRNWEPTGPKASTQL